MATERKRIQTYVDQESAVVLRETAQALGQTQSALLAEVLENAVPVLRVLRDMALTLQEAPTKHREALAQLAERMEPLVEAERERVQMLRDLAEDPPTTNRGVTFRNV